MNDMEELELLFDDDCEENLLLSSSGSSSDDDMETILEVVELCHRRKKRNTVKNYCEEVIPLYTEEEFISHFRIRHSLMISLSEKFAESEIYQSLIEPAPGLHAIVTRVSNSLSAMAVEVIKWPSHEEKTRTMNHFQEKAGLRHVIGSIDGTHIRIDQPSERAVDYYNRKDYYSMNVQGICDENLKFIDIFLRFPGSVHDARVFKNCTMWGKLESLCDGCYLLGGSAYPLLQFLLTPYRDNGHLTAAQMLFNTKLSSCRISIEHAFGVLKQRFRQLYHLKLRGSARICHFIRACCVLHNMADKDDMAMFLQEVLPQDVQPDNSEYRELRARGQNLRDEICQELFLMQRQ